MSVIVNSSIKKPRMTVHVDISKRRTANKKRKYEVAFGPETDPAFKKPFEKAKRVMKS